MNGLGMEFIAWFGQVGRGDIARVGGKNASLGELTRSLQGAGINVPPGFAVTAGAYWKFIDRNGLRDTMSRTLEELSQNKVTLAAAGLRIREAILQGEWPAEVSAEICHAYAQLSNASTHE